MATIHNLRSRVKTILDDRSAIVVLAHDELFDIVEPFALMFEDALSRRRPGYPHLWTQSDVPPALLAELKRIRFPFLALGNVLALPRDTRVLGDRDGDDAPSGGAAMMEAAA